MTMPNNLVYEQERLDELHRNGYDKQGNKLNNFTRAYVTATDLQIRQFVQAIETEVTTRPKPAIQSKK